MKNNINETMSKYTAGEITLEQANEELKKAEAGFHLDPNKNVITEEEKRQTVVGYYPEQANGFGMLDSGTGTMDKVQVKDGHLVGCDMGESYALCIIGGKVYEVRGDKLVYKG